MIQANELRIGNWLNGYKSIGGWKQFVVHGLNIDQFEKELRGDFSPNCPKGVDNVEPIPLTPEILEKAGFVSDGWGGTSLEKEIVSQHSLFFGKINSGEYYGFTLLCDDCSYNLQMPHIKHLHQLQNLYFALTGTELEIEL